MQKKIISLHDVLEPLKQALLASRDVIISGQIWGSKLQSVFTLGDGCWLPIDVAGQKLPRDNFCLSTVSQLPSRRGNFEREKKPSLVGERQFWKHFRRQFGREQSRVKNCRETAGSQFLPRDIKVSRRALWEGVLDPPRPKFRGRRVRPLNLGGLGWQRPLEGGGPGGVFPAKLFMFMPFFGA